jgi:outer membrane receptor for ferrienterochelin and colicin
MCKVSQKWARQLCTLLLVLGIPLLLTIPRPAAAQSLISGDIAGTVTDPSGAAIQGATVTATNTGTGLIKTVQTSGAGEFKIGLLQPGTYTVSISAPNFQTVQQTVSVVIGQTATANAALPVGKGATTVEVLGQTVPLLQTENSDVSTTITQEQVQNLPNPGGDITYFINLAPGVVMNTEMGYGNSSAFGLPATSNNFTVNGAEDNDPFLNLNNSGPSNLLLGQNDVGEVNVVANAYSSQYGALGGVQENITTRSGTNQFHGNLIYFWTNSDMNANTWLNDNTASPEAYANANQFGASLGGPIKKDKTFFFVNYEGMRFVTSPVDATYLPSALYETNPAGSSATTTTTNSAGEIEQIETNPSVLGNDGNCDNASSSLYASGNASECGFYQKMFAIYNAAPRASTATAFGSQTTNTCLMYDASGKNCIYANTFPTGLTYSNFLYEIPKNNLAENLVTARLDQRFGPNDTAFIHYKYDHGIQPTYVDPIDSVFDAQSNQPDDEGQLEETHTFTPNLVNQFILSGTWYSAYFLSDNQAAETAAFPYQPAFNDGSFNGLGDALAWPEGRDVTQYQINDDVSWTRGKHTLAVGMLFKRDDVTDEDLGVLTTPLGLFNGPASGAFSSGDNFSAGSVLLGEENFPTRLSEPIRTYNLGLYGQDQWKVTPNFQITAGLRVEHNSNPVCVLNCFGYLPESYYNVTDTLATPYNTVLKSGIRTAFNNYQKYIVDPRVGFTFSLKDHPHTVFRGGFGMFSDVFPATIADSMLDNAPLNASFLTFGTLADPSVSGSFTSALAATNAAFVTGYASGGSYNSISTANSSFTVPNLVSPSQTIHYPTYEEWSLQWEQQIGRNTSFSVGYVGNHGYHEPVQNNGVNAYSTSSGVVFGGLPSAPALPEFGEVTQVESAAVSNYNGLIGSLRHESKYATATLNYAWSHALDEISNGGILPFGVNNINPIDPFNLALENYGNADYDVKSSMNGNYILHVPYFGGPKLLTDQWQVGGTLFYNTGFPFSVTDSAVSGALSGQNYGGSVLADPVASNIPHKCGHAATNPNTPCFGSFIGDATGTPLFADPTAFGGARRNQYFGPGYFDTDVNLMKGFKIPAMEAGLVQVGVQAYNVLNHPDFAIPNFNADSPQFGLITGTVSPPTSVYGAFLGGNASARILQMKAKITF